MYIRILIKIHILFNLIIQLYIILEFEITGSPLKYSFGEDDFENSTILIKQNWYKEEEKYLPLNRTEAW